MKISHLNNKAILFDDLHSFSYNPFLTTARARLVLKVM